MVGVVDFWLPVLGFGLLKLGAAVDVLVALGDLLMFCDRRADLGTYYYRTPNVSEA